MVNGGHHAFKAADRSYLSLLKREVHAIAAKLPFTQKRLGELDIVVSEITSNLVKHAKDGELLVQPINDHFGDGIELIALDGGSGIDELEKMMADGASTTRTLGQGLGAIKRLSDTFQVFTLKDWGTVLLSRMYVSEPPFYSKAPKVEVRCVQVPKPHEEVSGDGYWSKLENDTLKIFVGDALGHGMEAHKVILKAIEFVKNDTETNVVDTLRAMHLHMYRSRGLVATLASYDFKTKHWSMCGIGNISTRLGNAAFGKAYAPYNGIVGANIPTTMNAQSVTGEYNQSIILCSDGVKSRWDIAKFPNIFRYDPSILAACVYKSFTRKTDDTMVLVAKVG